MKKINVDDIKEYGKFAVILKCLLSKNNITQGELAEAVGLSGATITNYIKGRFTPSHQNLEKIARYLNVSPKVFHDDASEYTPYLNSISDRFSKKLTLLIKENEVSQEDLANALGVSRQTINYYVNGKMMPMNDIMEGICKYFGVDREYFFENEEMPQKTVDMRIMVTQMPKEKSDCLFIYPTYLHEYSECRFGGICDLKDGKCSHLCVLEGNYEA